jgi:2-polyprenyl-3-methyl-5-hydroxy-6-metoxy-1,4-benzoquinol methylase
MKNELDIHVKAYEGANLYDFDNNIMLSWYPNRIVELVGGKGSLLELGLGHGFTTNIFEKHFRDHTVLDGSSAVIENFRSRFPHSHATIIETYFEEFETDKRYDVIVLGFILEHVDDPVQIMSMYRKFLSVNGRMFISVPNAEVLNRRLGHLAGLLPDMQELSENDILLGHKRFYTVDTLKEDINRAGYTIERMEGIYLKPFTTKQMLSLDFDKNILDALCKAGVDYPELSCGILAELKEAK